MAVHYLNDNADKAGREEELLRLLKLEESEALGYRATELQQQQIDALKAYFGELYGDEEDGRSRVVTREVFETIEWTRPDLMRVFAAGGNIISLEETSQQDSQYAKDAADYLNWVFFTDNPGSTLLDDFAFDGLLHRCGFIACYWVDTEYMAPETLTGLNIMQVQELMQDQNIEIIGQDMDDSEAGGICLQVRRIKSPARAEIVTIAPEDMRLNGRVVDIDSARYAGRVMRMLRGEIMQRWPDKADEVAEYSGNAMHDSRRGQDVRARRFVDQEEDWRDTKNFAAQQMEVLEEYLRCDLNGDGYPETIRAYRLGDLMLEESEVNENPFGMWTPIRIPHRLYGLSQYDVTYDLQRRNTVLTRAALDATYQSVVNREAYDSNKVKLDDLLATYAGAKVAVDGDPAAAIKSLTGGIDTATVAWEALAQSQQTLENRTGATRQTQGVDADTLLTGNRSGRAIDLLQTAGASRKEMMARNMGAGLSAFLSKLYRLVCRNQNQPRQAKVGGKWAVFDPRPWNASLRVMVHTGLGTGNREQTLMGVQYIQQFQDALVEKLGPDNPLVTADHVYAAFEEACRALGFKSAEKFMAEPPQVPVTGPDGQPQTDENGKPVTKPWAPSPQPDPEAAKIQAEMQLQQMKMQQEDAHTKLQYQKDIQLAQQQQQDEMARAAIQQQADTDKAHQESIKLQLEAERLQFEREKAAAELRLKEMELQLKSREQDIKVQEGEASRKHEKRMKLEGAEAEDADAVEAGKPTAAEALMALVEEMKRPKTVKRGKDGKVEAIH